MKRIVMIMCSAIATLLFATNAQAASHPSTLTRSEQFILDSMRMEVERISIEAQLDMYSDSLQHNIDVTSINSNTSEEVAQLFIPVTFFTFVILIVWIACRISYLKHRERYRIIEKAIENGQAIPQDLFNEPQKAQNRWSNTLRNAIIYIAIGIGLAIFGATIDTTEIVAVATIPGIIGLGYVLIALIERHEQRKEEKKEHDESETPAFEPMSQKALTEE